MRTFPIINGLTDYSHPCQAMADYLTMLEVKGQIAGLKVAFIGDGNNVAHSLMFAGAQLGANVWVATPPGYEPEADAVAWCHERCAETQAACTITNDPGIGVLRHADVVYTDIWASMGQESEAAKRSKLFRPYQVNAKLFGTGQAGSHLPALPAGASRRRGDGRRHRLAAVVCVSAGREPSACAEGDHAGTHG